MNHSTENVTHLLTIREAANELGLKESSIRRMIADGQIKASFANQEQIFQLLGQGRIKGVPGTGIRLLSREAVTQATLRPKRGRRPSHTAS